MTRRLLARVARVDQAVAWAAVTAVVLAYCMGVGAGMAP